MKKIVSLLFLLLSACALNAAPPTRTIIVFPFENRSSNSDLGWMSEAFAEVLSWRLAGSHRFVLGRQELNTAYRQLGAPPDATLTLASEYKIAQTLGVDWAVVGSFRATGQALQAQAQLLDLHDLKLYPAIQESGALSDMIKIQTRLAWRLLATHSQDFTVGNEEDFARRFPPLRLDALENYIRGLLASDGKTKVQFLTAADRLSPDDHRAALALGQYYFKQKDYADSVRWLSKLNAQDSDYYASLFLSGIDDFFLGHNKEAENDFRTLSQQIPLNEVWNNLGVLEARRADYQDALTSFERAYQGDETDADYAFNLGACYCYLKQYRQAAHYLQQALAQDQDDLGVRTLLAYALQQMGDQTESQAQLQWVAEHDGKAMADLNASILPQPRLKKTFNGAAFRLLAVAVSNSLEKEFAHQPPQEHGRFHLARGEEFIKEGRFPEAIRELTEADSLLPNNSEVCLFLGQAYELYGEHQKALDEFNRAIALNNNAITHLWLAHAYLSLHQPSEALSQSQMALSMDPGNRDAEGLIDSIEREMKKSSKNP
jgi:tetratricopeptide (TPR) repeat protein